MIGKVAKCQRGMTGLITTVLKPPSGSRMRKPLYKGVCIDRGRVGLSWQSMDPEWVGTIDEWVELRFREIESERVASDDCTPTKRNLLT